MDWFKKYFSISKKKDSSKEEVYISYLPGAAGAKEAEGHQEMEEKRKERNDEEKATDDLKLVVSGAKVQCNLCTNPIGTLMVNFPTPTIQNKPIATTQDNTKSSLVFMGTCTKSPNAASPCAAVIQLGQWQDTGSLKIQDKPPLLQKSTIKCLFGGVDITIMQCGQISQPPAIKTEGAPVP